MLLLFGDFLCIFKLIKMKIDEHLSKWFHFLLLLDLMRFSFLSSSPPIFSIMQCDYWILFNVCSVNTCYSLSWEVPNHINLFSPKRLRSEISKLHKKWIIRKKDEEWIWWEKLIIWGISLKWWKAFHQKFMITSICVDLI